jgi:3-oxoacyl-(acyl-carrier-protein) synthase
LNNPRVYIKGAGIVSPLGNSIAETVAALRENRSEIAPLALFPLLQGRPLPVGQVRGVAPDPIPPRTHQLALAAATQAMAGCSRPPDAIIIGTTTGGILTTEQLLRDGITDKPASLDQISRPQQTMKTPTQTRAAFCQPGFSNKSMYRFHGLSTVAEELGRRFDCSGPILTVSTACSSGAVAITLALELLRDKRAKNVLVGGVDSLCRLTYFGFHSLQLVDKNGCRPFDKNRRGMAVAEGAGMLLLSSEKNSDMPVELLGAGLSCDAFHPAAPHPEGKGARAAMRAALHNAGLSPETIDYINLHGTGTPENDLAESRAVRALFPTPPALSSIKGATGHSLAAAGAIEAVVASLCITNNLVPANTGLKQVDPDLKLHPVTKPINRPVTAVLSNSFGFGGNNGSLVLAKSGKFTGTAAQATTRPLSILGFSCLTGAGEIMATLAALRDKISVTGQAEDATITNNLPPRLIRRLKRLPRMALSLAVSAYGGSKNGKKPLSIFMGTGWGALSETHDFLDRLTTSKEQFPSPTDFVGSVHNGPAGQVAMLLEATGANITTSGGDYSFEQALMAADLLIRDDETAVVLGADEGHKILSPLLDASIEPQANAENLADGGGALHLGRERNKGRICIRLCFYASCRAQDPISSLMDALAGADTLPSNCCLVLAGIPAAAKELGKKQLEQFIKLSSLAVPVSHYREYLGEFASASAVAAALAASCLETGQVPAIMTGDRPISLKKNKKILVLGLGKYITAMELYRP